VPPTHSADPRVLYICGWGRSGTTVVDRVLGQVPGFFSVGELRSLWDADPAVQRCGCGETVITCPLWGPLLSSMASTSGFTTRTVQSMRDEVARSRNLLGLRWAASHPRSPSSHRVASYGDVLESIYRAVLAFTGSGIVVDSSKHPADALLLAGRPHVDVTVLHLVRDPRGVAYSWSRRHAGGAPTAPADRPPRRSAISSSAWWTAWNGATEALIRPLLGSRYIALRYEDVMNDPQQHLGMVVQRLGGSNSDLPVTAANDVVMRPGHTVAGNPSRMRNGAVRLAADVEWETVMTPADRWQATVPALPLMGHYGYPVRRVPLDRAGVHRQGT
jgi:hypothetical protein